MGKCKCPPAGAPEWVLTYGDMMSLLLTFFILLVALSEIKVEKFKAMVQSVHAAFGMVPGSGGGAIQTTALQSQDPTLVQVLKEISSKMRRGVEAADADDPGVDGRHVKVTQVREDLKFLVGGFVTFEPGSADLTPRAKARLDTVSKLFAGYMNKVELRGHAATVELLDTQSFSDLRDLSFARAKAVEQYLVASCGIKPERLRLIASADREPLAKRVYLDQELEPNRRVEIMVSEALVEDFTKPQSGGQ